MCFWDYPSPFYVEEMCQNKLYPPRLSVVVRGPFRPDDNIVKALFTFPGAEVFPGRGEPPVVEVILPLKARQYSLSTGYKVEIMDTSHVPFVCMLPLGMALPFAGIRIARAGDGVVAH